MPSVGCVNTPRLTGSDQQDGLEPQSDRKIVITNLIIKQRKIGEATIGLRRAVWIGRRRDARQRGADNVAGKEFGVQMKYYLLPM